MHLLHSIFSNDMLDSLKSILLDGYLKSSSKTKNSKLYGYKKGSKFVFLRFGKKPKAGIHLFLDKKLLLEYRFYLHIGWNGEISADDKKYNEIPLTETELDKLIGKHEKEIVKFVKESPVMKFMSNEVLVCNNISLEKYLLKIQISNTLLKNNNKILDFIKEKYPKVKIDIF